ncbi:MAG: ADP-ribosylglycohydrolase family protein [Christensenellaceae bacterium]|nr:ADP-ribosylglycohydrolase family protein [Christensenellaceae bacterium]
MSIKKYNEQIYAGVLGKIIGVYLGRPIEGWTYKNINKNFGEVNYYLSHKVGAPFIVPDDDISGTFVFYRALEDNGYPKDITAKQIGEAWLNYIIEDKTILWWGGLARSTEHSAYLRLKQGIQPPFSGSGEKNGMIIAEQIGSQIFIDTWAMVNPGNPERAAKMAREAAIVSHDGIAVEAAVYLAAIEAMAFDEKNIDTLLSECRKYIGDNQYGKELNSLLDAVISKCDETNDWLKVREWIEENHNYSKYKGNCPMVTNHLAVIMALKLGGDNFRKSISIATSCGWDTDCNSGNVGCLNGIRLGLDAINEQCDLRGPVADRMYVISSDGGDCVYDAVRETRKIFKAAAALNDEIVDIPSERYTFEQRGSVQGFMIHTKHPFEQAAKSVYNSLDTTGNPGLVIEYEGVSKGISASVAVQTYVDPTPTAAPDTSYYEVYASPALYSSQTVTATIENEMDYNINFRFFIDYYNEKDEIATIYSEKIESLNKGLNNLEWKTPDTGGRAIYKLGLELLSDTRKDGKVILRKLDWKGAPEYFHMGLADELTPGISPFVTRTKWMMAFMNSTRHTGPDFLATLAISHPEDNGVLTIGTIDWEDYSVSSRIQYVHAKETGLVSRAKGHRRYYGAILKDGKAQIVLRKGREIKVLAENKYNYIEGDWYDIEFEVNNTSLVFKINNEAIVKCNDDTYKSGSTGYMISEGAIVAKGFTVKGIN